MRPVVARAVDRVAWIRELRLPVGHLQPPESVNLAFELAPHADLELADLCCEVAVDSVVVGVPKQDVVRLDPLKEAQLGSVLPLALVGIPDEPIGHLRFCCVERALSF